MFGRLRKTRPSHATLVAYLALFIALGGTSFAALKLSKNAVKANNIAPNAVNSSKVKNSSLLAQDFAAGQLPAGGVGPKGDPGPRGERGLTGTPDPSNFYDKAASDSRFIQGNGLVRTSVGIANQGTDTAHVGTSRWEVWYSCPAGDPSLATGTLHFRNLSTSSDVSLYSDNGSTNPAHVFLAQAGGAGDTRNEPANAAGEAITFDANGFPDGRIAHIRVVTLNRGTPFNYCEAQAFVAETFG